MSNRAGEPRQPKKRRKGNPCSYITLLQGETEPVKRFNIDIFSICACQWCFERSKLDFKKGRMTLLMEREWRYGHEVLAKK